MQIKTRSNDVEDNCAARFAVITHETSENFYFVFYSERTNVKWIISSEECQTNKTGKNVGKCSICFSGSHKNSMDIKEEYCKEQFKKYISIDFSRFH